MPSRLERSRPGPFIQLTGYQNNPFQLLDVLPSKYDLEEESQRQRTIVISGEQFRQLALAFNGTEQVPHFERIGFKVSGKRMFATYLAKDNTANVFLTPQEQALFCEMDSHNIYPVPNKWGEKGATTFNLNRVEKEVLQEALLSGYNEVMKPKSGKK